MPCLDWLRSLRILVLDDEAPLRRMLEELLRIKGISVQSVATAQDAERAWFSQRSGPHPFHAALVDLSLGEGPDGREFALHLRRMDPLAKIFACTGDLTDPVLDDPAAHGFEGALSKPFLLEELLGQLDKIRMDVAGCKGDRKTREESSQGCQIAQDNARIGAGEDP